MAELKEIRMKQKLMTPGPTPIPPEIMNEMAKPIIHHRTPEYQAVFKEVSEGLKEILGTKNDVVIFTSSGTGAMEASVSNFLSPNDKAIVIKGGKFGERFAEICETCGVKVIPIDIEWGTSPDPGKIRDALNSNPDAKAVFTTLCETSTATVYDIKSIGGVVNNSEAILVVDAISGLAADGFQQDAWSVDVAVGGSQKGLMIPPGLSFCSVSKKAWNLMEKSKLPKYYFDLKRYKKSAEKNDVPFTPAITLMLGLKTALDMIKKKGLDKVLSGNAEMADHLRDSMKSMGLKLFSKSPSNAVTAVCVPEGGDSKALVSGLKKKGITVAGGQAQLKGRIFRIAHMGGITEEDIDVTIEALREVLERKVT